MRKPKPKLTQTVRDNSLLKQRLEEHVEITPEQRIERDATISSIFQARDDAATHAKLRKEQRNAEVFELLGGKKTSLSDLFTLVTAERSPYETLFPNSCGFWQEIFRLNEWHTLDSTQYAKPRIVGKWVCELIYDRYIMEVLPALRQHNPMICNGFREHKHFQYLTSEGKDILKQFRNDAIDLMRQCGTWADFRHQYLLKYRIGYQTSMFGE